MAGLRWPEEIAAEVQLIMQAEKIFNLALSLSPEGQSENVG